MSGHNISLLSQVQCNLSALTSNDAFRFLHSSAAMVEREFNTVECERDAATAEIAEPEARLLAAKKRLRKATEHVPRAETLRLQISGLLGQLMPRLMFRGELPVDVMVSIMGHLSQWRRCAAVVSRVWCSGIQTAKAMGKFKNKVLCVSATGGHSVVCTSDGVFTFGSGASGRLGHGGEGDEYSPRWVEGLGSMEVTMASAGDAHTVVCTNEGQVCTFGEGACARLGHRDLQPDVDEDDEDVDLGPYDEDDDLGPTWRAVPRLIDALVGKRVVCISAGSYHTALCTNTGELYTCGGGCKGQQGNGERGLVWSPQLVQALVGTKVAHVAAGGLHTVVCTDAGAVLSFGINQYGQLGHGKFCREDDEVLPRVVEKLAGSLVVGVAAGNDHTIAWTAQGDLFTWGAHHCLGHGEMPDHEPTPHLVEALVGKVVTGGDCGSSSTAVWTDIGELYTFGNNACGQLGHGTRINELVPRLVQALVGKKVMQAGIDYHTVVSTDVGEVFTFGRANLGAIGHGHRSDMHTPALLDNEQFVFY